MAHKKGVGSTDNGRDSNAKFRGVKLFGGQLAKAGSIIVRQKGSKYHAGNNVGIGKDWTLFSLVEGSVAFTKRKNNKTVVHVEPFDGISYIDARRARKFNKEVAPAAAKKQSTKASKEEE